MFILWQGSELFAISQADIPLTQKQTEIDA